LFGGSAKFVSIGARKINHAYGKNKTPHNKQDLGYRRDWEGIKRWGL